MSEGCHYESCSILSDDIMFLIANGQFSKLDIRVINRAKFRLFIIKCRMMAYLYFWPHLAIFDLEMLNFEFNLLTFSTFSEFLPSRNVVPN